MGCATHLWRRSTGLNVVPKRSTSAVAAAPSLAEVGPPQYMRDEIVKTQYLQIIGWAGTLLGSALYLYGYALASAPAMIAWPSWMTPYVPNWFAETGLLLSCLAMIPLYWKASPQG